MSVLPGAVFGVAVPAIVHFTSISSGSLASSLGASFSSLHREASMAQRVKLSVRVFGKTKWLCETNNGREAELGAEVNGKYYQVR